MIGWAWTWDPKAVSVTHTHTHIYTQAHEHARYTIYHTTTHIVHTSGRETTDSCKQCVCVCVCVCVSLSAAHPIQPPN